MFLLKGVTKKKKKVSINFLSLSFQGCFIYNIGNKCIFIFMCLIDMFLFLVFHGNVMGRHMRKAHLMR